MLGRSLTHTRFLLIALFQLSISFYQFNYDVIISLTVDVFTLGPFNESLISLLNMDKF